MLPPAAAGLAATCPGGPRGARGPRRPRASGDGSREEKLDRLFAELELPLIPILARMEAIGVAIDRDALATLDAEFAWTRSARLEPEIFADVGHEFTIGSPKQLGRSCSRSSTCPRGKRTKTGFSTDASVLEELRGAIPRWNVPRLAHLLEAALAPMSRRSRRCSRRTGASTRRSTRPWRRPGRLTSSDPNLQNIPIRTTLGRRIRRAFVAGGPEVTLLAADYSQIELRILAHVSGDEHLRDAFAPKPTSIAKRLHASSTRRPRI